MRFYYGSPRCLRFQGTGVAKLQGSTFGPIHTNVESVTVWWSNWASGYKTGAPGPVTSSLCPKPNQQNRGGAVVSSLLHLPTKVLQIKGTKMMLMNLGLQSATLFHCPSNAKVCIFDTGGLLWAANTWSTAASLDITQDSSGSQLLTECQGNTKGRAEKGPIAHIPRVFSY